jgi:hypothetical protein
LLLKIVFSYFCYLKLKINFIILFHFTINKLGYIFIIFLLFKYVLDNPLCDLVEIIIVAVLNNLSKRAEVASTLSQNLQDTEQKPFLHIEWIIRKIMKFTDADLIENTKYKLGGGGMSAAEGGGGGAQGGGAQGAQGGGAQGGMEGQAPAQGGEEPPAQGGEEGGGGFEF